MATSPSVRVLAVDDEESNRTFVTRVLTDAGYEVVVAPDGPAALEAIANQTAFDLFLLDVLMPQMEGDELARRVRERIPDAKILYFTAYADRLFQRRRTLWQNEAFIEKPVTVGGLLEAVSLMLFGTLHGERRNASAQ